MIDNFIIERQRQFSSIIFILHYSEYCGFESLDLFYNTAKRVKQFERDKYGFSD